MNEKRRILCFLGAMVLFTVCLTSCTQAAEINVACDVDDLIQAVHSANADSDTTKLILSPNCTYAFTAPDNSDGGHCGNALPIITTPVVIEGNFATLRYEGGPQFRFFLITNTGSLGLNQLTLENGYSIAMAGEILPGGGAIYITEGGVVTIRQVTFRDNYNLSDGGAILNRGTLYIDNDSVFENNHAERGGAIFNTGGIDTPVTIYNTQFINNYAGGGGGAIYNTGSETDLRLGNVEFVENWTWSNGGAIYTDDGDWSIVDAIFNNNEAQHYSDPIGRGGAIYKEDGEMSISGTTLESNEAYQQGGSIYQSAGSLVLNQCRLRLGGLKTHSGGSYSNGEDGDGGGIYNLGMLQIESSTLESNHSAVNSFWDPIGDGGAIYNGTLLEIANSTIANNRADNGAGVYNTGTLRVRNSTFTENIGKTSGSAIFNAGNQTTIDFTTIFYNTGYSSSAIQQEAGTFTIKNSIVSDSPGVDCRIQGGTFTALGDNFSNDTTCPGFTVEVPGSTLSTGGFGDWGGSTMTVSLLWNSAAVNHADCLTIAGDPVTRDQRGVYRPFPTSGSHACDIGAFEQHDLSPPVLPAPPLPSPSPAPPEPVTPTPAENICTYIALENLNCRESDYRDSALVAILMKGEEAVLTALNPTFTYGKFRTLDGKVCWMWFGLLDGPEKPVEVCDVPIVEAPPPPPTATPPPECSPDLDAESCKASGGTYESGGAAESTCVCP